MWGAVCDSIHYPEIESIKDHAFASTTNILFHQNTRVFICFSQISSQRETSLAGWKENRMRMV